MPDYRLTLNGRPDWRVRARLVKAYRHLAQVRGRNARIAAGLEKPLTPPVAAAVFFVFRTNRRHDRDNLISGLKAAWDGLKDARLLVDDSIDMFSVVHIGVEVDRKAREAVVRVRLMGGDARSLFLAETLLAEERAHLLASGGRDVDRG